MSKRVIIAGGGTGGHIFPAIAIARALQRKDATIEILFVGANGKMEMEKVPQAGFKIVGLEITGFNRSSLIKNIGLPLKLLKSFLQVNSIIRDFKPDAVIGVGGYSSFPVLKMAQRKRIPTFIHESNSFAGKSNIMLGRKAKKIFTGSDGMEKFFPKEKILITGNPVRPEIARSVLTRSEGLKFFSLEESKMTVLVLGGSLGAKSINEAINKGLDSLVASGIQLIWQTGKLFADRAKARAGNIKSIWVNEFISQMEYAYAAADVVVSRSGAIALAEICVAAKPVLFVPYPYAAEDHQTVNAMQLVKKKAALMVKDNEVSEKLVFMTIELVKDVGMQEELKKNIGMLAISNADDRVAEEIVKLI